MTPAALGNKPASEMTYRQAIVLHMAGNMAAKFSGYDSKLLANRANEYADAILARESQEASDERG